MDSEKTETAPFELHSGRIQNRIKDVFGCLDELELKHKAFERSRAEEDADTDRQLIHQTASSEDMDTFNSEFKHPGSFSGRDYHSRSGRPSHQRIGHNHNAEFKKPTPPSQNNNNRRQQFRGRFGRGRGVPDYRVHPERWTEYSLEDVDVSDSANKKAAFSFLNERKSLQEKESKDNAVDLSSSACSRGQFLFKRPSKNKTEGTKSNTDGDKYPSAVVDMDADFSDDVKSDTGNIEMEEEDSCNRNTADTATEAANQDVGSQKRKLDEMDDGENSSESRSSDKPVGFKSRKTSKRQIRSRRERDDDSD